jgi:hypothetical protein
VLFITQRELIFDIPMMRAEEKHPKALSIHAMTLNLPFSLLLRVEMINRIKVSDVFSNNVVLFSLSLSPGLQRLLIKLKLLKERREGRGNMNKKYREP